MKPFERLRDGEGSDLERMLLDSAVRDLPSSGARERTLAALGVAGIVGSMPGPAFAATKAASAGGASAFKAAGTASGLSILKWLGIGAAIGTVTAAGVATITTPNTIPARSNAATPETRVTSAPAVPRELPRAAAPVPEEVPAMAPPEEEPTKKADALVKGATANSGTSDDPGTAPSLPDPVTNANDIAAEVASLDQARAALAASDPRTALIRLSTHETNFPDGVLEPEAVVLRVRAWLALGRRDQAASIASAFLAANPKSAQAARLRALIGTAR